MNRLLTTGSLALTLACLALVGGRSSGAGSDDSVLAHDVYFTLEESTPETRQALVDACREYLTGHEGTVFFAAGTRATEMEREVNDTNFDVSLHVYFRDSAAHDAYQEHPRHKEFIEKMGDNWKSVRVFDSRVATGP
jgi:hypothetical protein